MDSGSRYIGARWKQLLSSAILDTSCGFPSATVTELLPAIRAETEPLSRAEGLLKAHQHLMLVSDQVLDDLRFASAVFASNARPHDEMRAVFMQAQVMRTLGYAQRAHCIIKHTLATRSLSVGERAALAYQGVHALTQMLRYDEAECLAQQHICPVLETDKGVAPRFIWWISLGYLRTQQFSRASRHPSLVTLDLLPGAGLDSAMVQHRLAQAQHCLGKARALTGSNLDSHILRLFELVVVGCTNVLAARVLYEDLVRDLSCAAPQLQVGMALNYGLLLQANALPEEAYKHLKLAADMARQHNMEGPLHEATYSLARLAEELGRHRVAVQYYEEFLRLHTRHLRLVENWFTDPSDLAVYGDAPQKVVIAEANLLISKPPYLRRALAALDATTSNPPSISGLAKSVGVTARTLEKAMKRYQGMTPKAYIRERRMHQAMQRLRSTGNAVAVIASELGYANVSSFSRDFRHVYGFSPSQARQQNPTDPVPMQTK